MKNKTNVHDKDTSPIIIDWYELKNLPEQQLAELRTKVKTGSDIDGVLCTYDVDKKDFRPFKLHKYHALAIPTDRCKSAVDVLITGRKKNYRNTTLKWLKENRVQCKLIVMFPMKCQKNKETFDQYKKEVLNLLQLETYYEDDVRTVEFLKEHCPDCNIIHIDNKKQQLEKSETENEGTNSIKSIFKLYEKRIFKRVPLERISPDPDRQRKLIDEENLNGIKNTINGIGLLQPIEVRPDPMKPGYYIINFGHNRYLSHKSEGKKDIECFIIDISDETLIKLRSLIENIQRVDLTSIERERAVYDLWESGKFKTRHELANQLGWNKSRVSQLLSAYEFRMKNNIPDTISSKALVETNVLPPSVRKILLSRVEGGTLSLTKLSAKAQKLKHIDDETLMKEIIDANLPEYLENKVIFAANKAPKSVTGCINNYLKREKKNQLQHQRLSGEFLNLVSKEGFSETDNTPEFVDISQVLDPEMKEMQNVKTAEELDRTLWINIKPVDFPLLKQIEELFKTLDEGFIEICKFYLEHHKTDEGGRDLAVFQGRVDKNIILK